jgi:hypothetical protein
MLKELADIDSLNSLMGRVGVAEDGLFLDLGVRVDEGHHNLVYNLLRTPPINRETLRAVPQGVAAVWVGALNDAGSQYRSGSPETYGSPIVTLLDFGREVFANITSLTLFLLPPDGEADCGPIPDVVATLNVNDPGKSEALWSMLLGLAGMAAGAPGMEGSPVELGGANVRNFSLPDGMSVYFTTLDHDVVIASTKSAMARVLETRRSRTSVLDDDAFAAALSRMGPATTRAFLVHLGRCAHTAQRFMPPSDLAEAAPFLPLLRDTVASLVIEHSGEVLRTSLMVSGIPDIGDLVAGLIAKERGHAQARAQIDRAVEEQDWQKGLDALDEQLEGCPDDLDALGKKFRLLAIHLQDCDQALACGEAVFKAAHDKATFLNNFAWGLLTEDHYGAEYADLALRMSERSNELTDYENWAFLDTLALAKFQSGDAAAAVKIEKKAIQHCEGRSQDELEKAFARYKAALEHE